VGVSPPKSPPPERNGASALIATRSTIVVSKLMQVAGIVLAFLEWAQPGPAQRDVLLLCALMVLGVDFVEKVVIRAIDRVFGE
jgi:hypothetical protein